MKLILTSILLIVSLLCSGVKCISNNSGLWSSPSTWSCGRAPQNGDTIIVSLSDTVTVDCNCGVYTDMVIEIYGTLDFPVGRKINLDTNGIIQIYTGGVISGGNSGSKILINGVEKWSSDDGPISGPASTCDTCLPFTSPPLPVELLFFTTNLTDYNHVQLEWLTASEINNDYFEILRSSDDFVFGILGTVNGSGNSSIMKMYSFVDTSPNSGYNYYKLIQYDFNGQKTEHNIIVIFVSNPFKTINVYPNPAAPIDGINVELNGFSGEEVLIVVLDVYGKLHYEKVLMSINDNVIFVIDSTLPIGTYLVVGSDKQVLYKHKLIIKQK